MVILANIYTLLNKYGSLKSSLVGDHVFIYIQPNKSTIRFGKVTKLSPCFICPFEILERIRLVAYRLAPPPTLHITHNVFHVSVLGHYIVDETHKIDWKDLRVLDEGTFMVEPLRVLDHRVQQLYSHHVEKFKVQWDKYSPWSSTSNDENTMSRDFPSLFWL